jgi:hypothetical protein
MKTKVFVILTFIALTLIAVSCEKNENNNNVYNILEYVNFFKLSDNEIVDSISGILNLNTFEYEGITDRWEDAHGVAGFNWIKEGKKYMNIDGHSIILWTDSINNLTTITYLNYRHSNSENWSNNEIQLKDYLNNIFSSFGFIQKPNEECIISESAGGIDKWYDVHCNQTYKNDTLEYPEFISEFEGDTCKINYMMMPVWYTNLDDINTDVSFNELEENAKNFFIGNYEGISDAIEDKGYWIVYNKLCKAFGTRIDGKRGIYRVFIDIQTGEIVFNTML